MSPPPVSPPQGYPPPGYASPAMSPYPGAGGYPPPAGYPEPTSGSGYPTPTSGGGYPASGQPYQSGAPGYPPAPGNQPTSGYPPASGYQPAPGYPPAGESPTTPGYPAQFGYPAPLDPAQPATPPKKSRGLMITAIVLGIAVLLCGGGGTAAYLFLRDTSDGQGAESPQVAVNDFLVAVYTEHDAEKAGQLVCSDARNREQLTKKIDEVRAYAEKYKKPKFSWPEPTVAEAKEKRAKVNVTVRITTDDERVAEQPLNFTVIEKTGWFVCEIQSGS
jgi:hypothetical protein